MTFKQVRTIALTLGIVLVAELLIVQGLAMTDTQEPTTPVTQITATPASKNPLTRFLGRNQSVPKATAKTAVKPKTIRIPKLNIATSFEVVGLDDKRNMQVPKDPRLVGWYSLGAKPGVKGNAVVSGHVDGTFGPAIFYKLNTLKNGDEIIVTDENNHSFTYKVTKKQSYKTADFPLQTVFGPTDDAKLNLITCAGTYDRKAKDYSNRLVVFATLVQ